MDVLHFVLYGLVAVTLGFLIYRYHRYSRWEDSDVGRAFMAMKVCLMALVLFVLTHSVAPDGWWRDVSLVIVVGGIWLALVYQVRVVVRSQGGFGLQGREDKQEHRPTP